MSFPARHSRKPDPSDVSDDEWSLVAPYLTLMKEEAPQQEYPLRELFNALRYVIRYGIAWRAMSNDLPPWSQPINRRGAGWLRGVLGIGAGFARAVASDSGTPGGTDRGDPRRPHVALVAGKRHPGRL